MYATCGNPGGYDVKGNKPKAGANDPALAIKTAKSYEQADKIDKLENLAKQKIFMWQGTLDEFITPSKLLLYCCLSDPIIISCYLYSFIYLQTLDFQLLTFTNLIYLHLIRYTQKFNTHIIIL